MDQQAVIQTEGLGRRFGRRWVVENLDLVVPKGAVFGLLGLNGAGKSTTIKMLMSLLRRHAGNATVLGLDPARKPVEIKRRVGYVPEAPVFYDWMSVEQMCAFAVHYRKNEWDAKRADHLIETFRLRHDARIGELSKGMRAKLALVLAMAFNPELLILDEPTSGLDPLARREFIEGVLGEYQEAGNTVLISSHLVNELAGLVDHVGIIFEGRLLLSEPADTFLSQRRRVRLDFADTAPATPQIKGLLTWRPKGREVLACFRGMSDETLKNEAEKLGATHCEIQALDLEDAFIEQVSAAERGVL